MLLCIPTVVFFLLAEFWASLWLCWGRPARLELVGTLCRQRVVSLHGGTAVVVVVLHAQGHARLLTSVLLNFVTFCPYLLVRERSALLSFQ